MKKIFGLTFLIVMLVGLVGCKPLTGDGVCVHTNIKDAEIGTVLENGEVVSTVTSAWYGYNESGKLDLVKTEVATHYVCTDCGKVFKKNVAFFTTDDHKTTIGKATGVSKNLKGGNYTLPLNDDVTIEFYNHYYENRNTYSNNCNCGGECVGKCVAKDCDCDKLTCIRLVIGDTNKLYFGDFYIEY